MALNFPPNKNTGDTHTENGITFTWNGTVWKRANSGNGGASSGIPSGGIIIWSGASNLIGSSSSGGTGPGWVLCDGNNSTPDLRERFIVGAGGDNSTVSGTSGYNVNATGGENSVTLSVSQIPSHNHSYSRPVDINNDDYRGVPIGSGGDIGSSFTTVNTGNTGGGQAHENRPPFYALCYIMKS